MKVLVVIDMQNDFIDGALGTPEAAAAVPRVVEKIRSWTGPIYATQDTHFSDYLETQEGRVLPVPTASRGRRAGTSRLRSAPPCRRGPAGTRAPSISPSPPSAARIWRRSSPGGTGRSPLRRSSWRGCVRISVSSPTPW